ncbi:MAG: class I SAM-dependent DNA methyltransferase [Mesorhizobium sp.]|nr:MAG: class I SAM-dependent DNA methyltransferase [Mesorhizobium sp.]
MNAVEIEEAVSELAAAPFDAAEFPFAFLTAFGNKDVTVKRLRSASANSSDVAGGVLQRNNIHIAVCAEGEVDTKLGELRASPKTASNKAKFILATDGMTLQAEDLVSDEPPIVCNYPDFAQHFGFFLPLAGISTVRAIKNNPIDIKATGRLNKLYVELLKDNPEWASDARRHEMNQFMARLIFCFFAEDTGIFLNRLFTKTVEQMSDSLAGNTHEVLQELFRAMDTKIDDRKAGNFRPWADAFPYVNGGLFTGSAECPRFSRIARSYLLRAAELNWQEINPDIFGSMIQAVADDEERGELGMHYTSVPNILKVLNPLFLDDLREQLEAAGDNSRKLRNLRKRMSSIRVFDPACGSGNFLVIAYREMRQIEHEIVRRTGDKPKSWVSLANFYGIEIKGFAAEIARLALLIAEFQCDVRLISQTEARLNVLPLHKTGQIHIGNALRLNWLAVCPPVKGMTFEEHDLAGPTGRLALDENGLAEAGEPETYVCGNPPYKGSQDQTEEQKADLRSVFEGSDISSGSADYVLGWFATGTRFARATNAAFAFVTTNSIHQGRQVARFWPYLLANDLEIIFAEPSFKWSNLAAKKAVVTVSIIGVARRSARRKFVFDSGLARQADFIGPYLVPNIEAVVDERREPISQLATMSFGSMPNDHGFLLLNYAQAHDALSSKGFNRDLVRPILGTNELTKGIQRYCLWLNGNPLAKLEENPWLRERIAGVATARAESTRPTTRRLATSPHLFGEVRQTGNERIIVVSGVSSEERDYLPVSYRDSGVIISNLAFGIFDAPLWNMALIASRIHLVWIATVCGKMKTDFRYSNTLGWNTFPIPPLTEKNKIDLTTSAENILLAREAHFPATITDLYDPENMPDNLRAAHERNDETLERIYIGRRFRNDTERLEKLFDLYTKTTADNVAGGKPKPSNKRSKADV